MDSNWLTIILGFIEGFSLIISPCILPILPIVLAGSFTGSKKRPLGIIIGFSLSFALFAFFSRSIVRYTGIDLNLLRHFAYAFLLLFALIMISSYLTNKFSKFTQQLVRISSFFPTLNHSEGGFCSGIFLGGLIAIIWTPCAGPILAAVIVEAVIQKTNLVSFFTLFAFAAGAAIPMFIIALYGRKIIATFQFFKKQAVLFRRILGVIIIISVAYMIYLEKGYQSSALPAETIRTSSALEDGLWFPYPAPEIKGIEHWINTSPLTLRALKGKVILIDFWTYSCINCLRTLPYLKAWDNRYRNKGLVIIGVHSPEFAFEKNLANVQAAIKRYHLSYPVALDNQFQTWRNYNNHYWPAHYLINKQGDVVYQHVGEGGYATLENNIRFLLGIDDLTQVKTLPIDHHAYRETPETYLGYQRATSQSPTLVHNTVYNYHFSSELPINAWDLEGSWQVNGDKIISAAANASVRIHFNARRVFVVMGNQHAKPIHVKLRLNGKPIAIDNQAKDVKNSTVLVDKHALYKVIEENQFTAGILQMTADEPGLEIYTFTFGS